MSGLRYPEEFKIQAVKQVTDRGLQDRRGRQATRGDPQEHA
jgi:transposase-like protein